MALLKSPTAWLQGQEGTECKQVKEEGKKGKGGGGKEKGEMVLSSSTLSTTDPAHPDSRTSERKEGGRGKGKEKGYLFYQLRLFVRTPAGRLLPPQDRVVMGREEGRKGGGKKEEGGKGPPFFTL